MYVVSIYGSSPRVRGTAGDTVPPRGAIRFIPACAGNRRSIRARRYRQAVHPRVCGEQSPGSRICWRMGGSSPRVRGTVEAPDQTLVVFRFIPACAGNRIHNLDSVWILSVHPRVCGEQDTYFHGTVCEYGSSPRVRGTVLIFRADWIYVRFIPACAGNSFHACSSVSPKAVHPRVCGEQGVFDCITVYSCGSSPRVRGTDKPR